MTLFYKKIFSYISLTRLNQPIGILLLLWPTMWALWLSSSGRPDLKIVWIFICGVIVMRSAGCVINDLADKNFDGHVERTKNRPLVTGEITALAASLMLVFLLMLALGLVWHLNYLTLKLSFLAVFLAATYPYMKRFFIIPQAYLGIAFGFGIPMAYASTINYVPMEALILLVANVFWAIAYDTEYAMVDRDDDRNLDIKTSALLFGEKDVFFVPLFQAFFLISMSYAGWIKGMGSFYFCSLLLSIFLFGVQYEMFVNRDRAGCFAAFKNNNWVGVTIFLGIFLDTNLVR